MKKRVTLLTAGILCAASALSGAIASGVFTEIKAQIRPDFMVEIDGKVTDFKTAQGDTVYPILYEGVTYLPLRSIGNIMGKTVYWYEDEKRIVLKDDTSTVTDADVIVGADASADTIIDDKKIEKPAENPVDKPEDKTVDSGRFIGKDRAKELALEKAGIVASAITFEKIKLDFDNGKWKYEIEFKVGNVEYDIDIAAEDGKILEFDKDID